MKLNWINSPPINQAFVQKGMSGERERARLGTYMAWPNPRISHSVDLVWG